MTGFSFSVLAQQIISRNGYSGSQDDRLFLLGHFLTGFSYAARAASLQRLAKVEAQIL
jgi:hypothetical protein